MCAGLFLEDARSPTEVWGSCKHLQLLFEEGRGLKKQTTACFVSWDKAARENGVTLVHEKHSSVSIASRADPGWQQPLQQLAMLSPASSLLYRYTSPPCCDSSIWLCRHMLSILLSS